MFTHSPFCFLALEIPKAFVYDRHELISLHILDHYLLYTALMLYML
jgi:hypothetical protein